MVGLLYLCVPKVYLICVAIFNAVAEKLLLVHRFISSLHDTLLRFFS